jgi:large subunit ribosomal protein L10
MDRLGKQEFVETFEEIFDRFPCMVVVRQVGLDASTTVQLRKEAREAGATFQVVKNRLAKRALHGSKEDLLNAFKGPTGVFFSEDPVSLAKFIANF